MSEVKSSTIKLLLVDDHHVTRLGLRTLLSGFERFEIVGEAGTAAGAVAEIRRLHPDVVLLDIRLPDGTGIEVCREIQKLGVETKALMLTSFADDRLVFEAIAAGADGYLLKEINCDALVGAIEDVFAGKSILDPAVTRKVLDRARGQEATAARSKLDLLSPQELRVIARVAEGKTNREIGTEMGLSEKTVKNYLSNALDKLEMNRRTQAAAFFLSQTPGTGA
ncbi:MAG: response regulator transcription factor [Verrucomicrobia bacterium]|nr:response regulator transcription factor [Verrucomicrobiota bacterium]